MAHSAGFNRPAGADTLLYHRFWRTILIAAVVTVCYFMGRLLDKGGRGSIKAFFDAIFKDNR